MCQDGQEVVSLGARKMNSALKQPCSDIHGKSRNACVHIYLSSCPCCLGWGIEGFSASAHVFVMTLSQMSYHLELLSTLWYRNSSFPSRLIPYLQLYESVHSVYNFS